MSKLVNKFRFNSKDFTGNEIISLPVNIILFFVVAVGLLITIYLTRPAPDVISSYSASLEGLTKYQKKNICLSARRINNIYVNPGDFFSFNKYVGPRTIQNGFHPAKALYERGVIESTGGGICLISSALYNSLVRAGLKITERKPHTNLIRSMPYGMDATVWYGINDLKFKNNLKNRVLITSECSFNRLNISIKSNKIVNKPEIITKKQKVDENHIQVSVYRRINNVVEKLSEDVYLIK